MRTTTEPKQLSQAKRVPSIRLVSVQSGGRTVQVPDTQKNRAAVNGDVLPAEADTQPIRPLGLS
jgi:hypothetical protein